MIEIFMFIMLAQCCAGIVAKRTKIPSPIIFVSTGLGLGFFHGFDTFQIAPDLIMPLFLPPLLMEAAYFTSLRDFMANFKSILQMAIGFVIVTFLGMAGVAHALIPNFSWNSAFILGAIVSPPDAIAATTIARQIKLPRRVQTILEGESLVNDATGLVLYKFAVIAAMVSGFSVAGAAVNFIWMATAGIGLGFILGWLYMRIFSYIREPSVEILSSFLVPYAAYFIAEEIGASGVLAVVAAGLTVGWKAPNRFSPEFRISAETVWRSTTFVFNGLVFLLIGLYFPRLLAGLANYNPLYLIVWALTLTFTAIGIRFLWVFSVRFLTRWYCIRAGKIDPYPHWQNTFVLAWTGMRGFVSLATALALPLSVSPGLNFPHRDLIIFLTFSFIILTLVIQGLFLPLVVRKIGVVHDWKSLHENWFARKHAADSALKKLESISKQDVKNPAAIQRIVEHYKDRIYLLGDGPNTPLFSKDAPITGIHPLIEEENKMWRYALEAERTVIIELRHKFKIGDEVMNDLLRDIDLMHSRFHTA